MPISEPQVISLSLSLCALSGSAMPRLFWCVGDWKKKKSNVIQRIYEVHCLSLLVDELTQQNINKNYHRGKRENRRLGRNYKQQRVGLPIVCCCWQPASPLAVSSPPVGLETRAFVPERATCGMCRFVMREAGAPPSLYCQLVACLRSNKTAGFFSRGAASNRLSLGERDTRQHPARFVTSGNSERAPRPPHVGRPGANVDYTRPLWWMARLSRR